MCVKLSNQARMCRPWQRSEREAQMTVHAPQFHPHLPSDGLSRQLQVTFFQKRPHLRLYSLAKLYMWTMFREVHNLLLHSHICKGSTRTELEGSPPHSARRQVQSTCCQWPAGQWCTRNQCEKTEDCSFWSSMCLLYSLSLFYLLKNTFAFY